MRSLGLWRRASASRDGVSADEERIIVFFSLALVLLLTIYLFI